MKHRKEIKHFKYWDGAIFSLWSALRGWSLNRNSFKCSANDGDGNCWQLLNISLAWLFEWRSTTCLLRKFNYLWLTFRVFIQKRGCLYEGMMTQRQLCPTSGYFSQNIAKALKVSENFWRLVKALQIFVDLTDVSIFVDFSSKCLRKLCKYLVIRQIL